MIYRFNLLLIISLALAACAPAQPAPAAATPTRTQLTSAPATLIPVTPSPSPLPPTATLAPSPTPTRIPPATVTPAPQVSFQTKLISGALPEPYLQDACQVIAFRWDPKNSAPGTVVVPVMFHSIAKNDRPIADDTTISEEYFQRFIEHAHRLGFETITSAQLVDFLQKNARIPARSLLMIVDDRKRGEFFETYFFPALKKYHWTVTNAWIAHPDTPAYLWKENEALLPSGLIDFQAHGVIHNTPIDENVTEAYARNEIYGAIQPIQDHFGKRPIAFIWPRGLFTPQAVQMAQEAGYQVGFTAYARGPLLFNWIPLGAGAERSTGNPLMVMPRYWSTTAIAALEESLQVSTAAQAFYQQQRASDLAYYQQYCQAYPELSKP